MPATLGVDIGGTSVKAAICSDGKCIHTGQSYSYSKPSADELRDAIRAAVGSCEQIQSIGLCVPGILDRPRRIITLAVNVPGLNGLPLDELVPQALGFKSNRATFISNDAAAAAHDIFKSHHIAGRLFVLTLGTGVGAAILDDGVPLHVEGDSPGHIGQLDVSIPGCDVVGPDGGSGGLEGYIGVAALRRKYGREINRAIENFTGDEPAILALARAIRICHAIYRPNHFYLCGGIGIRLKHLLPIIREKIQNQLTSVARADWKINCGEDNFHAARGVAQLAGLSV